ncbi:hypothetical protein DESC_290028 [Desulfosarcina cetonica]|nr:hypothetical protein DESC_290028 [Desulfosarcina cetonica]
MGRIDGIHDSGLFDQLVQGDDIKTEEPVQRETERGKEKHTRTEEIPELFLEQTNEEFLARRVNLVPENNCEGNRDGSSERRANNSEEPKFIVQSHPARSSLTCLTTSAFENGLVI